jgi:sugar lactone lactonase YvrE
MQTTKATNRKRLTGLTSLSALVALASLTLITPALVAQSNSVIFSNSSYISSVNSTFAPGSPDYNGDAGRVAINKRGDVIFTDAPTAYNSGADDVFTVVVPATGGQADEYEIVINMGYNSHGIYVDANNNVYVGDTNNAIYFIPFVNNAYPSTPYNATATSTNPSCTFPLSGNTVACTIVLDGTAIGGVNMGYIQVEDLTLDASGNIFVMDKYDAVSSGAYNRIIEFPAGGGTSVVAEDGITPQDENATIAVDSSDGIYYASETYSATSVSYFPKGSSTPTAYGTGLVKVSGVALDKAGNLYIVDSGINGSTSESKIVEIPNKSGISTSNQYTVINFAGLTQFSSPAIAEYGPGIDDKGAIYYIGDYANSILRSSIGSGDLFESTVGTPSSSITLIATYNSAFTLSGFAYTAPFAASSTQPSTGACAAGAITAGTSCQVNVIFSPTSAGNQIGEITANNNPTLGAGLLTGVGQASLLNVDPGAVSSLGTGYTAPAGVAVDLSGNAYIADTTAGKIYKVASGGSTATAVATGLTSPSAVAIDGANNLYVSGTGDVVELPWSGSAYGAAVTVLTGLSGKSGLAIDGSGDLFVADSGNSRVLVVPGVTTQPAGGPFFSTVIGSGFETPVALAVDTNNDLYISDAGTNSVYELGLITGTKTTIVTGLTTAAGIALDPAGSLFVVDSGAKTITKESSPAITIGTVVAKPGNIAIDNAGNIYATDSADATAGKMNRSAGALSFGAVGVGVTSATLKANVSDGGNETLVLKTPYYTQSSSSSGFSILNATTCASGASVDAGASCSISADFVPPAASAYSDTLTFSSNAVNVATLALSGTGGTALASSTTTLVATPNPATGGASVTLKATVASSAGTPTGTVKFTVGTLVIGTATLSSGVATFSASSAGIAAGTYPVTATYSGSTTIATSADTVNVVLNKATPTVTASATPNPATPGQTVTLKAIVSGSDGAATGTVTFTYGTLTLGTATLSGGSASFSASSSGLPAGSYVVKATYNGNSEYASGSGSVTVVLK